MLHLLDNIYFDYDFTGNVGRNNLVYIGKPGQYHRTEGTLPLYRFDSLDEINDTFGDFITFLECLTPIVEKTTLLLDEETLNRLLVQWLRSVFPNISVGMVHRIIKLNAVNHKYEHGSRTNTKGSQKEGFQNLKIPKTADTKVWYEAAGQVPLTEAMKERVSFEYLMAHALLVDFDVNDRYVLEFTSRMETVLWRSIAWDFVGVRRDLLYGIYNLKNNFGLNIDLEYENVEEQIASLRDTVIFDPDNHPGNVEFIKRNHASIGSIALHVHTLNGTVDPFFNALLRILPDGEFTPGKARSLVNTDKTAHCSQIFGRTEFRDTMNNNFIGYLYTACPTELTELTLNTLR